jgi:hypothetical protein
MGYVHDTAMSLFISVAAFTVTVGTWAMTVASHLWTLNHTAADNTSVIKIPIKLQGNSASYKGSFLKSIDIWWINATADLDALSAEIYAATLPAQAGTLTASAQTFTYDSAHDSAAKRITQAVHYMKLTLTTPIWMNNDYEVYVELTVDAAATSAIKLYGARANFTLRM